MKNVSILALAAFAVGVIVALVWMNHRANKQAAGAEREYRELTLHSEELAQRLSTTNERYDKAISLTRDIRTREWEQRERSKAKIANLETEIAELENKLVLAKEERTETLSDLPTLDDERLAERSLGQLAPFVQDNILINTIGPELFQVNRPYVQAAAVAATEATFLRSQATTYELAINAWMEKYRKQESLSNSYRFELSATKTALDACEEAVTAHKEAEENANLRLKARTKQVEALERKLSLQRIKGLGGMAAGVGAGILLGHVLH